LLKGVEYVNLESRVIAPSVSEYAARDKSSPFRGLLQLECELIGLLPIVFDTDGSSAYRKAGA
jgi:hypothetical protein